MNAVSWIKANCKFAAGIGKTLAPQELQQVVNNLIIELKKQLVPNANYMTTKQQVSMALQSALNQRGAGMQMNPKAVEEIMRALGFNMPAQPQMQMGPQGWEDPAMSQFRKQRPIAQPLPPAQRQMPRKSFE